MQFSSRDQHSVQQLHAVKAMLKNKQPSDKERCYLLSQLAAYGETSFADYYEQSIALIRHPAAKQFALRKQHEWQAIQAIPKLQAVLNDKALCAQLLDLKTPYFEKGLQQPEKLLVVFTTMYNNFYLSNPVFLAFIRQLGVSVLILKDTSMYNYLNGISGFGNSFDASVTSLKAFIAQQKITSTYLCGFSSGGYASLLMSSIIACAAYLGFSICSDISPESTLPRSKFFTSEVSAAITDSKVKVDLAAVFRAGSFTYPRKIIYGEHTNIDKPHAEHLAGISGIQVAKLINSGHITLAPLLVQNMLLGEFQGLIS